MDGLGFEGVGWMGWALRGQTIKALDLSVCICVCKLSEGRKGEERGRGKSRGGGEGREVFCVFMHGLLLKSGGLCR